MRGRLLRRGDAGYDLARRLYNPIFDALTPAGIAYCADPEDVIACVQFAGASGVQPFIRSGGHSYAGYSSGDGLVIDVSGINEVAVDAAGGTARIGPGARLIDVYSRLAAGGVSIPAGSCPSVGIAGLTLGGGVGVVSRRHGLTCDNLLAADVVTAEGRLVTCDAAREQDLFWALRGGGGSFGVVTSLTFRTHPASDLTIFSLAWPWSRAAVVLQAWTGWAPQAPDELWSNCLLLSTASKAPGSAPQVLAGGAYEGSRGALEPLLRSLVDAVGAQPSARSVHTTGRLDAMLTEAGCVDASVAQCHLAGQDPAGRLPREAGAARSDYLDRPLSAAGAAALAASLERRQASPEMGPGGIGIDAYGGAINRVATPATAFVHRGSLASIQYNAVWNGGDAAPVVSANRAWLAATHESMRPHVSGAAYQNYADPELRDWQTAYYGSNLDRLRRVKRAYDPGNLFRFGQSIPPA